jgi:hypothetical protein
MVGKGRNSRYILDVSGAIDRTWDYKMVTGYT